MYSTFEAVATPVLFLIGLAGLLAILAWLETPKPRLARRCREILSWQPVGRVAEPVAEQHVVPQVTR